MLYFVLPEERAFPGIARLFAETIAVVGGKQIYLVDMHQVTEEDTVMFGAWSPRYAMAIRRGCNAKRKYLHWSSPLLQAELAGVELGYLSIIMDMLNKGVIDGIWMNDKGIYDTYSDLGNLFYAPAPFNPAALKRYRKEAIDKEGVFFFTVFSNKQKNIAVQLAAAKQAQKEQPFVLYVNGLTPEFTAFADAIRLRYVDLKHLPSDDYFEWLSSAQLMLGVAASEAFAYTCAESLCLGVPVLMSPVVANNMGVSDKRVIINDISSVEELKEGILNVLSADEKEYEFMCEVSIKAIEYIAIRNNQMIIDVFNTNMI
jgi:glycosyltransferase involved in cell wall biosynthesis